LLRRARWNEFGKGSVCVAFEAGLLKAETDDMKSMTAEFIKDVKITM
jgi:hypothetical protein